VLVVSDLAELNLRNMEQEVFELFKDVVVNHSKPVLWQIFLAKLILYSWYCLTRFPPFKYECTFVLGNQSEIVRGSISDDNSGLDFINWSFGKASTHDGCDHTVSLSFCSVYLQFSTCYCRLSSDLLDGLCSAMLDYA